MEALVAENIVLGFSGVPVTPLPLSFSIPKVGLTAIIGKNGAGKSTLLNALAGEPVLLSGTISYHLDSVVETPIRFPISAQGLSKFLAYFPQDHLFPVELRVGDFLELAFLPSLGFFGQLDSVQKSSISEMVDRFELDNNRRLGSLSTGERQRVFLARTLLQKPKILLLDEPTNHLDPSARHLFWKLLKNRQNDLQVIVSTHDMFPVRELAGWVLALECGRIIYNDTASRFWEENQFERVFGVGA